MELVTHTGFITQVILRALMLTMQWAHVQSVLCYLWSLLWRLQLTFALTQCPCIRQTLLLRVLLDVTSVLRTNLMCSRCRAVERTHHEMSCWTGAQNALRVTWLCNHESWYRTAQPAPCPGGRPDADNTAKSAVVGGLPI